MNKYWLIVLVSLCTFSTLWAQAPIIVCDTDGEISEVDLPNNCNKTLITDVGISLSDITLHPNGKMYGTRFSQSKLYEIDLSDGSITELIDFDDANPVGMTAASNGKIYVTEGGSPSRLFEVDVITNTFIIKGILANGSAGDLSWSNGEMYNASSDNQLVKVDIENPENSQVIGEFDTFGDEEIFSLVTAFITCDSSITYGISDQTNQYYIIDLTDASLTTLCSGTGARIFGATSADEFSASDTCTIQIDLDDDNSSTASGADYLSNFNCTTTSANIADIDVLISAVNPVDSIVISLTGGILDGADEFLQIGSTPNIVSNNNSTTIVAVNNGAATNANFETFSQTLLYRNTSTPASLGDRTIEVIAYSNGENSNSGIATITISGGVNPGADGILSICSDDDPVNLTSSLNGSPQTDGTWNPTLNSGDNTFDPLEDAAGTYTYTVTDGCVSDSSTVEVTINTAVNAGEDGRVSFCTSDDAVDLINSLEGMPALGGTWTPALTSTTGVFDPAIDNEGTYTYTVSGNGTCSDATAAVSVTVNVCNLTLDLDDDNSSGATGSNFESIFNCIDANAPITDIDVSITSDSDIDSVIISISSGILDGTNEFLQTGVTNNITANNSATSIIAINQGSATEADFQNFLSELTYTNTAAAPTLGDRLITVTVYSDGNIEDAITTVSIPSATVNAGSDNSITISDDNTVDLFNLLGSSAESGGAWTPALNSGTNIFDPTNDSEGAYTYIISNDCDSDTATITVSIREPSDCQLETLFVPTGFTPNNDGQNDVLFVNLKGSYTNLDFRIYNRWGEIVFETNDILVGWDGNFSGQLQTTDVFGYFLQIECDGEIIQSKGNITVVR